MRTHTDPHHWPFPFAAATTYDYPFAGFCGFIINGGATVEAVAGFYGLDVPAAHQQQTIADYLRDNLYGYPLTGDRVPLGGIELIVIRKCGRVVEQAGLDFSRPAAIARARRGTTQ